MKNLLFFLICLFIIPNLVQGQDWESVEIKVRPVSDQVYMLEGRGGNIAFLTGEDGILLVDAQFAPLSDKILEAISETANGELTYVLNTHWHGDHTGGNVNFSKEGATIIAHDNVRARVSTEQNRAGRVSPPQEEIAWPVLTFDNSMHIHFNGEDIHLFHVGRAHTDGDAMVFFEKANVLHMGDVYFANTYPLY